MTKGERLAEFYRRLLLAPPAKDHDEAFKQMETILNAVEDEFSGIEYNLETSDIDGRLYPPSRKFRRKVPGHPELMKYAQRRHFTVIAANGAIEIRLVKTSVLVLAKSGADGKGVSLEPN